MSDIMSNVDLPNEQPPLQSLVDMPRRKQEDSSFGPRLAELRKARGLTQVQLAEAAGTTQRAISYYENDTGFPPASALIDLAHALKVSTDELLGIKAPKVERIRFRSGNAAALEEIPADRRSTGERPAGRNPAD
jgi:transcriptional regulator with XRE-family HTH domain